LKKSIIAGFLVLVLIISSIFIYIAASNDIFFTTMRLIPDDAVLDLEGEGYELPFYMYGKADSERNVKIATVFHDVKKSGEYLAHIIIKIIPEHNLKVDSLHLDFTSFEPTSAFILENPVSGESDLYNYERLDYDKSIILDFPKLNAETSEIITVNAWLDLSIMQAVAGDRLLNISFSVYEESIFKIVKYEVNSAINLAIPFTVQ
jgi:hypothetical protein